MYFFENIQFSYGITYMSDPKPVLNKKISNNGILKQDLKCTSIVELKLPDELQFYQDIDDLIRNQTAENIEETFNKLKGITEVREDFIYYIFNVIHYYTFLRADEHKYDTLVNLLSTIQKPEYDNNFSTLFESETISKSIRHQLRDDNIESAKHLQAN